VWNGAGTVLVPLMLSKGTDGKPGAARPTTHGDYGLRTLALDASFTFPGHGASQNFSMADD